MRRTRDIIILVTLVMLVASPLSPISPLFPLFPLLPLPLSTVQAEPPSPGMCDGIVCGPSGELHPASFPTMTAINWDAFPPLLHRTEVDPAQQHTFYVATTGADSNPGTVDAPFATLDHAVAVAEPGTLIWVADGVYPIDAPDEYEALRIDKDGLLLLAENMGGVTLVPTYPDAAGIGIQITGDDVTIDGFVISGFREAGIEFGNGDQPQRNLRLQHLIVEHTAEGIRATYDGDGSQPVIEGMLIHDVWLREITLIGLQCGQGPCNSLRWEALRVDMSSSGNDSGADGIAVESGENIVVFNAEVSGASGDGIDLKTASGVVANVIVHDVRRNGIKIWHGGDIINALVYNTGADAALVFEAGEFRILNTLVARHSYGDSAYAMTAAYDTATLPGRVEIINSVFYQNSGPVWISPTLVLSVQHSLFFGSGNGTDLLWRDIAIGTYDSAISALENVGAGVGNLNRANPLFADPAAGDYAWGAESPLRDAGTDAVALPAFDLYGLPRVGGDAVDLGPVEFHTHLTP
ncbi:MAG: right-handed parallel beta-helix repeat-containing protein [Anaerolineae bacterium]|nr:right-handed parallel beta-helix repeat-containing protein [Anaerolineae bacterium]